MPGDLFNSHLNDQIYDDNLLDQGIDVACTFLSSIIMIIATFNHHEIPDNNLDQGICGNPDLAATINFNFGLACGKRDSRVRYENIWPVVS